MNAYAADLIVLRTSRLDFEGEIAQYATLPYVFAPGKRGVPSVSVYVNELGFAHVVDVRPLDAMIIRPFTGTLWLWPVNKQHLHFAITSENQLLVAGREDLLRAEIGRLRAEERKLARSVAPDPDVAAAASAAAEANRFEADVRMQAQQEVAAMRSWLRAAGYPVGIRAAIKQEYVTEYKSREVAG